MFEIKRMVSHCCVGTDRKLKLGVAADMMMDCCQDQEIAEKELKHHLLKNDMAIFLVSMQLDLFRRPDFGEHLNVRVMVYDCKSIYGYRRITIHDEKGTLCMIANAVGAFFNFKEGRAVRLPDDVRNAVTIDPPEEMECLPRKIIIPSDGMEPLEPFRVMRSRLDQNHHLTSSEYLAAAEDRLPDDFSYNRVRVEFKLQAKAGEIIQPNRYHTGNDAMLIHMVNPEGHPHAAVEFSTVRPG